MKIISSIDVDTVLEATRVLLSGGVLIYPTETCYGIGVDATNPAAVSKLLTFKRRPEGKAISVAVADQAMAEKYVELNEEARNLYRNFLPGPMTVISTVKQSKLQFQNESISSFETETKDRSWSSQNDESNPFRIDQRMMSEQGTLGIRIPDYPLIIEIVNALGRPITATSANISSLPTPYSLIQWQKQTAVKSQELVDLFIDAGTLPKRPSSTVVDTTRSELTVLRQGMITIDSPLLEKITTSEEETKEMAIDVIHQFMQEIMTRGLVIGLQGDLGMGKTRFAKGVGESLGIEEEIRSPTFTLVEEYHIMQNLQLKIKNSPIDNECSASERLAILKQIQDNSQGKAGTFFHIDAWRMESEDELLGIGFEEMIMPGNVVVIEWVEKVTEIVQELCEKNGVKLLLGIVDEVDGGRRWRWKG